MWRCEGRLRTPAGTKAGARGDSGASGWVADRERRGGVNGTGAWRVPEGRRGVSGGVSGGAYPATTGGVPLAERATSGLPDAARRARCRFLRSTSPPGMPYRRRHRPPHVRATPPPDTTRVSESPRARVSLRDAARNRLAHRFHRFPTPQPNPTTSQPPRNPSRRPSKPRQLPKTPPRAIASSCARFACKVTDLLPSLAIATGETSPPRQRVGPSSTRSPPRPPAGERTPLALTWTHP